MFRISQVLLWSLLLAGCAALRPAPVEDDDFIFTRIEITADHDANQTSPTPVDLVFVYEEQMLARLQTMTAAEWFAWRDGRAGMPQEEAFWLSHEVGPGQTRTITDFPEKRNHALALVVFARYQTPGVHREIVRHDRMVRVFLHDSDLSVVPESR